MITVGRPPRFVSSFTLCHRAENPFPFSRFFDRHFFSQAVAFGNMRSVHARPDGSLPIGCWLETPRRRSLAGVTAGAARVSTAGEGSGPSIGADQRHTGRERLQLRQNASLDAAEPPALRAADGSNDHAGAARRAIRICRMKPAG